MFGWFMLTSYGFILWKIKMFCHATTLPSQLRHISHSVSNYRQIGCLFNSLFINGRASKYRLTGPMGGKFHSQRPRYAGKVPTPYHVFGDTDLYSYGRYKEIDRWFHELYNELNKVPISPIPDIFSLVDAAWKHPKYPWFWILPLEFAVNIDIHKHENSEVLYSNHNKSPKEMFGNSIANTRKTCQISSD